MGRIICYVVECVMERTYARIARAGNDDERDTNDRKFSIEARMYRTRIKLNY